MRDYETIETALTAAETGHLVLSTLHTLDATETVNRIISVFPPHQQKQIRLQLASVLKASCRCASCRGPTARAASRPSKCSGRPRTSATCIENKEKTKLIRDAIAQGTSQYGMQTFDQSLTGSTGRPDLLRGGAAPGHEPRRVQAQGRGDPLHLRHVLGADGQRGDKADNSMDPQHPDSPFEFSRG
jgi:Tfp pilus assembly pilus retraction ATPase PilT